MRKYCLLVLILSFVYSCTTEQKTVDLYVDVNVNTSGDGSMDNPFTTISNALTKAKEIKSTSLNTHVNVNLLEGEYYLDKPIMIDSSLSGLSIIGAHPAKVILKGSRKLVSKWQKFNENIYVTQVSPNLNFDQLIIDDETQILARYPNYDENGGYWQGYAADAIGKEKIATWKNPIGAYFHVLHNGRWGGFHYKIIGLNEDGTPKLEGGHQNNRPSRPHEEYRMVENVFEELDAPGEWFLDKANAKLYYYPTAKINLENAKVEVSTLKSLIQVIGTTKNPVKNVTISNIGLQHTERTFMEKYEPLLRSDWTIYRGGVVFFEGTENCTITNSILKDLGGNAILASKYNADLRITENHIYDCGGSAISFIGDPSAVRSPAFQYGEIVPYSEMDTLPGPKNELYPRNSLVENNLIHRIGRTEKQTAGVQIAMAMDITIRSNSIYDVPRAGINIGDGTWGGHLIEKNDVFNTVLETSDHGSFNSWGRDRFWHPNRKVMDSMTLEHPKMYTWDAIKTTTIRQNRFRCDHGWDIDLDDGSSNYHIYNNLCLNNGIKLREGFERVVENNILVNNSLHPHVWFANSLDVFKHNIVAKAYQDVGLKGWGDDLDYNLFSNEESMMKSQIYSRDIHSTYGDPQFKDPSTLDFTVTADSLASTIGFKNFPMNEFGVQIPALKKQAKTPTVPVLNSNNRLVEDKSPTVEWLRNSLKSVDSEQEQSAYGLNSAAGVIVLGVWNKSPAVQNNGLKKGDVIIAVEGQPISTVKDFFTMNQNHQNKGRLEVVVMRNQSEKKLTIQTK
ncbi:Right handed beta helix region [Maribacter dokdonensis]|uniref:Right handed beta helix region n=1 Tax=Maribacter dokdonensis TaxID=320912 RepID=A0A1H4UH11_9FLAO|nr:PDZ domain-containing protein [Maribacter dokdonensis]SEC68076.1 Right handed beta helix region [Maribacter dokdonensis]